MWKQFLKKLPKKSSKSEAGSESPKKDFGDNDDGSANPIQRTSSGNVLSGGAAAVKRMSSAIFPSTLITGIEPLLSFKDVGITEKQNLYLDKLNICCIIFDFLDPSKDSADRDLKRQTLIELVEYVNNGTSRFTEQMIAGSCRMFAINLFRIFPPNYRAGSSRGGEREEEEPMFDPAWSHLQIVYELLLKFVSASSLDAKIGKKYFDQSFVLRLLDLFDSEDPRERDCLKTVLHRIYGKFMVHRPFIRKAVSHIFYRFVFEMERHNGIAELLEVFGSIISGFALPLKEEHKLFLWKALIPLHKPKSVGVYLQQLIFCITQFIEKDPKLASTVIMGLLKYWPVTNSQKELMFLSELEEVLETTSMEEFQKCMVPLFRRIGYCLNSSHFQVAERALFLWNNDHLNGLIAENRQVILPLVIPALERNARHHWNQAVLNVTSNVRKMFSDMNEELFVACQSKFEEEEEQRIAAEEKRRMAWERLETAAAFQPVTRSTAVLVSPVAEAPPLAAPLA